MKVLLWLKIKVDALNAVVINPRYMYMATINVLTVSVMLGSAVKARLLEQKRISFALS